MKLQGNPTILPTHYVKDKLAIILSNRYLTRAFGTNFLDICAEFTWPRMYNMKLLLCMLNKTLEAIALEDYVGTGHSLDTELGSH